jgi:hypothetical protein
MGFLKGWQHHEMDEDSGGKLANEPASPAIMKDALLLQAKKWTERVEQDGGRPWFIPIVFQVHVDSP